MARKYRKQQLPGMRKPKSYSVIPTCSRCGVRQGSWNSIRIASGRFSSYCNECNTDVGFMRRYKNKSQAEVLQEVNRFEHYVSLLREVLGGINDKEVN